jgi:HK97 family phage major capsid protein
MLNADAITWAQAEIAAGRFILTAGWTFTAEDAEVLLGDPPDWDAYGSYFLDLDSDSEAGTFEYYRKPLAKLVDGAPLLHRAALQAARDAAADAGDDLIAAEAQTLITALDEKAVELAAEAQAEGGGGGGGGKEGPIIGDPTGNSAPSVGEAGQRGDADPSIALLEHQVRDHQLRERARALGIRTNFKGAARTRAELVRELRGVIAKNGGACNGFYERGAGTVARATIDEPSRTAELVFSSETPVLRWYGYEILDHSPGTVPLSRLTAHGPLLVEHDPRDHVGTTQKAKIGSDRVGRATVRFGKSARATEVFQDVVDDIRKSVSVGYYVRNLEPACQNDDDGEPVYRATWEPVHISLVAEPADLRAGIGRNLERGSERTNPPDIETPNTEELTVTTETLTAAERTAIRTEESERVRKIHGLGQQFANRYPEAPAKAQEYIDQGKTLEEYRAILLENLNGAVPVAVSDTPDSRDIGLTENEARNFRFMRLFNALANPADKRAQDAGGFELEACAAFAARIGRGAGDSVTIPAEVLRTPLYAPEELRSGYHKDIVQRLAQRLLSAGGATSGAELVPTELLSASFIDLLRNRAVVVGNATMLRDLNGNVDVPKLAAGASGGWISTEGAAAAEQTQTTAVVAMSPKTVGAWTKITRRLMLQNSTDVEALVRNDLALALALALDLASISGSGTSGVPKGIALYTGIGGVASSASLWEDLVDLETEVAVDNADVGNLAYAMNAKTRGHLKKTPKISGQPVYCWEGSEVNGYRALVSNQFEDNLGTGSDNRMIFGNWADLLVGLWGGLEILVDRMTESTAGNTRVTALQEADIAPRHEESFAMMDDLTIT